MPLRKAVIGVPVAQSIDAGADAKITTGWTKIENGELLRRGAISKRSGRVRTSTTTVADTVLARQIATLNGKAALIGNQGIATVLDTDDVRRVAEYEANDREDDLVGSMEMQPIWSQDVDYSDHCVTANHIVAVTDSGDILVIDPDTGSLLASATTAAQGPLRCVEVGTTVFVYYAADSGGTNYVARNSVSSAGVISAATVTVAGSGIKNADLDVCVTDVSGTPTAAIAHLDTNNDVQLYEAPNGVPTTLHAIATVGTYLDPVACWERSAGIVDIAYAESSGGNYDVNAAAFDLVADAIELTEVTAFSYTQATYSLPLSICGVGVLRSGSGATMLVSRRNQTAGQKWTRVDEYKLTDNVGAMQADFVGVTYNVLCASKPVAWGSDSFVVCLFTRAWYDDAQETAADSFVWVSAARNESDGDYPFYRPVAKAALGRAKWDYDLSGAWNSLGKIETDASGRLSTLQSAIIARPPQNGFYLGNEGFWTSRYSLRRYILDFASNDLQHIEADQVLYTAGAMPRFCDGQRNHEVGFLQYPAKCRMVTADSTGNNLDYVATYEIVDRTGKRHQSIPSTVEVRYVGSAGDSVTVRVPSLSLGVSDDRSSVPGGIKVVLWRRTNSGPYRRVASASNDQDLAYISITDTATQATADSSELLYTTGNILEYDQPPPFSAAAVFDQRMWVAPSDDLGNRLWYSRRRIENAPYVFNRVLGLDLPDKGGPVTALAVLGERLLIFKARHVFATWGGPGPDNIGAGPNYIQPHELSSSIGCVNPRSIVDLPQGVFFESHDGLWSVDSGGNVAPAGDRARHYFETASVTQGVADESRTTAIWQTSDGEAVVYDWMRDAWGTWESYQGLGVAHDGDNLVTLASDRHVWTDDPGNYADNAAHYSLLLESQWFSLGQLAGFQRVLRILLLGENIEASDLDVRLGYNFDPAWDDDVGLDLTTLEEFRNSDYYGAGLSLATYSDQAAILEITPSRTKCTSIRLQIKDGQNGATVDSEGYSLTGIAFVVGVRPTNWKIDAGRILE